MTTTCPSCHKSFEPAERIEGHETTCPYCGQAFFPESTPPPETKSCPYCLETIKKGAIKCRYCGEFLDGRGAPLVPAPNTISSPSQSHNTIIPEQKRKTPNDVETSSEEPQEEVLMTIHATWKILLPPGVLFVLLFIVLTVLYFSSVNNIWLLRIGLLLLFADFLWFCAKTFRRIFTVYTITTYRLRFDEGFITRNEVEVRHKDVRATWLRQTITERLMDYGDILIGTSATSDAELSMDNVDSPKRILDLINQLYQGKTPQIK